MHIHEKLGSWYEKTKRDLPWRNSQDPYKIYLSEIILQQTRVAQGINYYHKFLEKFPDIFSLAKAENDEVLKIWQGLGYYSRARHLHETARFIAFENKGNFPSTFAEILTLKGVGEYTAAAVSSMAFNEAVAAVDGNVKRVISRLFLVENEINSTQGKKIIKKLAGEILDPKNPGRHNQAIMELGALVCLPTKPLCTACPLNTSCLAFTENKVAEHPVKYNNTTVKDRFFIYLVIKSEENIWLKKRENKDIWRGLYEFPLIETPGLVEFADFPALIADALRTKPENISIHKISQIIIHKLSHRNIICRFLHISVSGDLDLSPESYISVNSHRFDDYAVPKLIERYISRSGF